MTISSKFTDTTPVVKEKREESEEELKKKEAILLAHEAADKFNKKHEGWIYIIPEWKAKNLTRKFDDLIKDKEEPKVEEKPAGESSSGETPEAPAVKEAAPETSGVPAAPETPAAPPAAAAPAESPPPAAPAESTEAKPENPAVPAAPEQPASATPAP